MERDGRSWDTFTGGRLHDKFERRNGEWKIAHRRTVFDGIATRPRTKAGAWATSTACRRAARRKDTSDPTASGSEQRFVTWL